MTARANTRTRANFTLAPATHAILAASGNASRYIDEAVRARDRRWRRALRRALEHGTRAQTRIRLTHVRDGARLLELPAPARMALRALVRELELGNAALVLELEDGKPARKAAAR